MMLVFALYNFTDFVKRKNDHHRLQTKYYESKFWGEVKGPEIGCFKVKMQLSEEAFSLARQLTNFGKFRLKFEFTKPKFFQRFVDKLAVSKKNFN